MWKLKELWNFILVPAIILLTLDFIYIYATFNEFRLQIAEVQRVVLQVKYLGAILCYFFLIFGLYYFSQFCWECGAQSGTATHPHVGETCRRPKIKSEAGGALQVCLAQHLDKTA